MPEYEHAQHIVTLAWWLALDFSVLLYILLDGADLGAGVFSLFVKDENERGAIMAAMAGTWDANETWLIVAGGILFGTFPFVYGSMFHYLMIPLMFALWGMIGRALALEFRHICEPKWRKLLDVIFGVSSLVVAFGGGVAVGAILNGFPLTHEAGVVPTYVGGTFRFLSAFSIWTGVAAVIAVTLSGMLFIRARFEDEEPIRIHAAEWTETTFWLTLAAVAVTVVFSAVEFPWAAGKWLSAAWWIWAIVALGVVGCAVNMRRSVRLHRDIQAILWYNAGVAIMAGAMMWTVFPWLVPGTWTIAGGASPGLSLVTFTLAMGGFIPVIVAYNAYQIWVFRARVSSLAAYH